MNAYPLLVIAALAAAFAVVDSDAITTCTVSEECAGMVPPECFSDPPAVADEQCPTCCCASSGNVRYYNESEGEPSCTAPNAVYQVKLVGAWTASCHPGYYPDGAVWSPLTGISHKPEYELWNACMCNASDGVALVSQTGNTAVIQMEYAANAAYVFDSFAAGAISEAGGNTSQELRVSSDFQYASVVTMLAPSADRMIGVSSLQLCDGDEWRSSVKVCAELFSTATKSNRTSEGRNSVQEGRCSFGYFQFTLLSVDGPTSTTTESAGQMATSNTAFALVLLAILYLLIL